MKRFIFLLAVLLAAVLPPSFAEDTVRMSTPTDLCPHEHMETVYYFDSPVYRPADARTHEVSGRALIEVHCVDCGAVLSAEIDDHAVLLKEHVFRKGICVLCGMEGGPIPEVQEIVLALAGSEENEDLFSCGFSVPQLENAGDILVLRAGEKEPAVVLQPLKLAERMDHGDILAVDMLIPAERTVAVTVHITAENGLEYAPDNELLSLRFYCGKGDDPIIVRRTDGNGIEEEQQAFWMNGGNGGYYMAFPYPGDGTYQY